MENILKSQPGFKNGWARRKMGINPLAGKNEEKKEDLAEEAKPEEPESEEAESEESEEETSE